MIIEAQFLVSFLLKAKKMGHKYYSIVRQGEYIRNITNEIYNIDNDYNLYKNKVLRMIESKDSVNIMKQLFCRPNMVFSISSDENFPFLCKIDVNFTKHTKMHMTKANIVNDDKFYVFVLNCLFHYSLIVLNEMQFMQDYFNYNSENNQVTRGTTFWGIDTSTIKSVGGVKLQIVESIMKQTYFHVVSQMRQFMVCLFLYLSSCLLCFLFLLQIQHNTIQYNTIYLYYRDKNC